MRILQLVPNLAGGGAERLVVDLCNQLVKNHEVHLLTLYDPQSNDLFRDDLEPGIHAHSIGKQLGFDWKVIPRIMKVIKKIDPDVVHSHLRSFNYLMPVMPFITKKPVVHTIHSEALKECSSLMLRKFRKVFFTIFNVTPVTISELSSSNLKDAYGEIDHCTIHNGRKYPVKTDYFEDVKQQITEYKIDNTTKVFVHIGRLTIEKNQQMLVEAFNRLIQKDKVDAQLLIIGGGRNTESSRKVQKKIQKAENEHGHIHLLGEKTNATDYLHAADFFCLSSLYEGMPITLIEALATGTIPICTPVGGIPEMITELDSSLLSKSVNVKDYYEALKRAYFLEEEKRGEFKIRARALFEEKYSIEHCAEKYENLFKKVT